MSIFRIKNIVIPNRYQNSFVVIIAVFAYALRVLVRLYFGEEYYWRNSYSIYYESARNLVSGNGFCFGDMCAWLPPVYPIFLSLSFVWEKNYLYIILPQALIGAGTVVCTFFIAKYVFHRSVGVIAAIIAAIYPYYVMHDTALQETALFTFSITLSVLLLLRASKLGTNAGWIVAGISLGLIPLIRASGLAIVIGGLLWCTFRPVSSSYWDKYKSNLLLLIAVALILSPWLVRNYNLVGAPIISSQTGRALWMGNNPFTFSHYPEESIDRSRDKALRNFSDTDKKKLRDLGTDELARSNWFVNRAVKYISENPLAFISGAYCKIYAAFSWRLNPFRTDLVQTLYAASYSPIAILGIIGIFVARRRDGTMLVVLIFLAFIFLTAIFWAHTSHRSFLDVFFIVFASHILNRVWIILGERQLD